LLLINLSSLLSMVAANKIMSSFPLPGQSLQQHHDDNDGGNKDPFAILANRKSSSSQQQPQFTMSSLDFFPKVLSSHNYNENSIMKSMSSDDFDIDHQMMDSSSFNTATLDDNNFNFSQEGDNNHHDDNVEATNEEGEEVVYTVDIKSGDASNNLNYDHRDDDVSYETSDYSGTEYNDDDDDDDDDDDESTSYQTEAEETAATEEGEEFTEAEEEGEESDDDDNSSVASAGSGDTFHTLLYQVEKNDVRLREMVIDTTSMGRETAEDLAQLLEKNTCVTTIRLSCKRLECKEGQERKRHVLSTLLSGVKVNTSIESVEIEDTDISHELAVSLSQLCARKHSLKNIAMIQCQFIGSGLPILFLGMQHSQSIRNVIFQSCDLGRHHHHDHSDGNNKSPSSSSSYNVEIIASALPLMNLTSLSLVDVNFPTEECLHYLIEKVEQAKELKLLDLSQNKLNERSVALLARSISRQNQISRLILSSCSLDNVCMKELAMGLRGYVPLTNLDVSKNKHISDRGAMQIKDLLKGNSKITKLNVNGCSFSEDSLDALEAALRYNNSFLKTFVSVSTGLQIFDVVDAIANLGVGGDEEEEEEEDLVEEKRRGGSSNKHHGDDRRRRARGGKRSQSRTPQKASKLSIPSPTMDRDRVDVSSGGTLSKHDDMRALFRTVPPDSSFDRRNGSVSSTPQRNVNAAPSLPVQKTPRSPPPPPPPPPPPRQDFVAKSAAIDSPKSNKSSISSPTADRASKQDEMRALFRTVPPDSSFDRRNGSVSSTQQGNVNVPPSLPVQKTPRSPPTTRQDFVAQSAAKDSPSLGRNGNVSVPQFFEDEVNFDSTSPSNSAQSGAKHSPPQRMNGSVPTPQFGSPEEFFPSGSGLDCTGSPQYSSSSSRRSNNGQVPMPQYEFGATSSSQSGIFKPSRQDIRSAKYVAQRKNAVQQSPQIDKVIQQLSPSRRDIARSPRGRSSRGIAVGKNVML
jgi:hypothetical protein